MAGNQGFPPSGGPPQNPYGFTSGQPPYVPPGPGGPPQMGIPMGAPAQQPGNGLAVAGMVVGIIGVVLCFVPFLSWILCLLAIIFGAIGNGKAKRGAKGKGMALAGLILGIVGLLLSIVIFALAMAAARRSYDYGSYRYNSYGQVQTAPAPDRIA